MERQDALNELGKLSSHKLNSLFHDCIVPYCENNEDMTKYDVMAKYVNFIVEKFVKRNVVSDDLQTSLNTRMECFCRYVGDDSKKIYVIELSQRHVNSQKLSLEEMKQLVLHQIAHAIDHDRLVNDKSATLHDSTFKSILEEIGGNKFKDCKCTSRPSDSSKEYNYVVECTNPTEKCVLTFVKDPMTNYENAKCNKHKKPFKFVKGVNPSPHAPAPKEYSRFGDEESACVIVKKDGEVLYGKEPDYNNSYRIIVN